MLVAVAASGLAEGFSLARSPYGGPYPATLGTPLAYRALGLPSRGFYTLKESASPAGLRRMKRSPALISSATALGLASLGLTAGGVGHSTRSNWN